MLAAPDVALAEAAMGVFLTIFFIICFEKYYGVDTKITTTAKTKRFPKIREYAAPLALSLFLLVLFINFIPDAEASTYLRGLYLAGFMSDIGGHNAVTAIYLGYRVYDTVFEALILLVGIVAVAHMSWHTEVSVEDGEHSEMESSPIAVTTIRLISPLLLLFGAYLIINGIHSPGGGFQGGAAIGAFFVCRYMIYNIFDVKIERVVTIEKITFMVFVLLAITIVFMGTYATFPYPINAFFQDIYLTIMNILLGIKVASGFMILFYRYVAIDRR
jgi:multicomponent Na+:H+ antiporter subunit B